MSGYKETQALWPQMIAALSAIDSELGLPDDGCNSIQQTLSAIRELRASARDQFAMAVLPALIGICVNDDRKGQTYEEYCAAAAYAFADAMMLARRQNQTNGVWNENDGHDPVYRLCSSLWRYSEL